MTSVTIKSKTVDDAIKEGLTQLGLSLGDVDIEILSDSKGFLGLNKSAQVKLTRKEGAQGRAEEFLGGLFRLMNVNAGMTLTDGEETLKVDLQGDQTGVLVGRRGETLDALQYLTSLVINRGQENFKRVIVDTENYREKREQTLIKLAERIAAKVAKTGKRVVLEPMNPYERRVLHATLQNNPKVETLSEGDEPYRKVIVRKKRGPKQDRNDGYKGGKSGGYKGKGDGYKGGRNDGYKSDRNDAPKSEPNVSDIDINEIMAKENREY